MADNIRNKDEVFVAFTPNDIKHTNNGGGSNPRKQNRWSSVKGRRDNSSDVDQLVDKLVEFFDRKFSEDRDNLIKIKKR